MNLKYSVVITSYNADKTIRRSIQGFLDQTVKPKEIIVVDDASKDNTWSTLKELSKNEKKIKIIQNTVNQGQSYSRNLAAKLTTTDFIIFGDDDDHSLPRRAIIHLQQFSEKSDICYVSSIKLYSNKYRKLAINSEMRACVINPRHLASKLLLGKNYELKKLFVPASASAVRKKTFLEIGGYDNEFRRLEDVDLALRYAIEGFLFGFSSEIAVDRHHSTGTDKGGSIDPSYELLLLKKYSKQLKSRELKEAIFLAKLRSHYFSHNYILLVLAVFTHRESLKIIPAKLGTFLRRVKHDRKILGK